MRNKGSLLREPNLVVVALVVSLFIKTFLVAVFLYSIWINGKHTADQGSR
jgi:hypothetical protein